MPFNKDRLATVGAHSTNTQTIYSYESDVDTTSSILASGYFSEMFLFWNEGDIVFVKGTDSSQISTVNSAKTGLDELPSAGDLNIVSGSTSTSGENDPNSIVHTVDPPSDSTAVEYSFRSTIDYASDSNILAGGYVVPTGSVIRVSGDGDLNKAVGYELQYQISGASTVTAGVGYEFVVSEVNAGASGTLPAFYVANMSAVPNIGNLTVRGFQFDHPNESLTNGPIRSSYGYESAITYGANAGELSPAPGLGYADNAYYSPFGMSDESNSTLLTPFVYVVPFVVSETWQPNRIGIKVAAAAAGTAILGIYNVRNGVPANLIKQGTGTADLSTTGDKELVLSDCTLYPGTYCLAAQSSVNVTLAFGTITSLSALYGNASSTFSTGAVSNALFQSTAYTGTLPAGFSASGRTATSNTLPYIWLRKV